MGGIIMNFITALLSLLLSCSPISISLNLRMILLINTFLGFGLVLTQGIPCQHGQINNDGTTFLALIRDKQAAKCYYLQLSILGRLQEGAAYKQLGEEIFQLPENADLTNAVFGWHKILQCYYYMDLRLWNKAEECLEAFHPVLNRLIGVLKYSVLMEMLFIRIIKKSSYFEIESLFHATKKLLYSSKADFHIIRVRTAYEIYKNTLNENKKENLDSCSISMNRENIKSKIQRELVKRAVSYPYVGEAAFCTGIIFEILNNY
jgi:hypothetical protein